MQKSGMSILLKQGDYEAVIVTVGAGMCAVKFKDKYISLPHDPDEVPQGHLGKVLIPWPNRVKGSVYTFEGKQYQLNTTEAALGNANHGFLAWKEWQIEDLTPSKVVLKAYVIPTTGYPFLLLSHAVYELKEDGLYVSLTTQNVGKEAAPYGVGQHPYITCNCRVLDECTLTFPCTKLFDVDDKMCPTSLIEAQSLDLDFKLERSLKGVRLDHAFENSLGPIEIELNSHDLMVKLETSAPYIQLYSAEKLDRRGLAVEPMSCVADAFNNGIGLAILKPGEEHTLTYKLSAQLSW